MAQDIPDSVVHFLVESLGKTTWTATRNRQAFRLVMMLQNQSPRALRLSAMFDRGEIGGERLLEMIESRPG